MAVNVLTDAITIYGGNWIEKTRTSIKSYLESKKAVAATIVSSIAPWGEETFSICFTTMGGQKIYLPLSKKSALKKGDNVKVDSVCMLTLGREGSSDTYCYDGEKA